MADNGIALISLETASRVGVRIPIAQMRSKALQDALGIWERKKGDRALPSKDQMAPRDMRSFLRDIMLFAVFEDGEDFEYRLMGDAAVVAWGKSFQGMRRADLNNLHPGMGEVLARVISAVVRRREPIVTRCVLWRGEFDEVAQETIFLPLSPDEHTIDHVLSVSAFEKQMPTLPTSR
jgi:hypothetical protein